MCSFAHAPAHSLVLWVESNQIEWLYPLLQPVAHYVPEIKVRFVTQEAAHNPLPDLIEKIP